MIGAGNGDGVVRILKDVILGTVAEIVEVFVSRWGVGTLVHLMAAVRTGLRFMCEETHVISFLLEPVEGVLGTVSAVAGRRVHYTVSWIGTASTRDRWLGQRHGRGRSGDIALESVHVVCRQTN